jgi:hypothetical protein
MKMITKTQEERAYMLKFNQHRFDFIYGNANEIGYMLDTRYVGQGISIELRNKIEIIIFLQPVKLEAKSAGQPGSRCVLC